ncbi:MAG: PKD domain-containing protein [Bacteroidales bacterium]|nr:PKD domain-containing protein [Bacteroidales bacterium]
MKHLQKYTWAVLLLLVIPLIYSSCKKEEEAEVIASFTFQLDASDYKLVKFTNTSQNYSTVSWAFGDGTTSTEVSPEHTYTAEGDFNVSMTVTSSGGATDTYAQKITISDPNVMLTKLVGATSKSWKLLRDVSTGVFPLEVGPIDRSTICGLLEIIMMNSPIVLVFLMMNGLSTVMVHLHLPLVVISGERVMVFSIRQTLVEKQLIWLEQQVKTFQLGEMVHTTSELMLSKTKLPLLVKAPTSDTIKLQQIVKYMS